ncbi:disease resistance protein RUN1-like [Eucalyptus grandis]|uniref:disease resistance protein RUN1-like n=1 Tax=Eucalyptus grandis TaxID=71139 RepID=UPI00192EE18B|nr:disease resistance protein RUN1-like [Eucalyptus grandis]
MEDHYSSRQLKRAGLTEASTPTISKRPRPDVIEELPLLLPSSDWLEKVNVPLASTVNSDPSASSTSMIGNNYHVFLSFRGPDTRKGFVDHLYQRLNDVGLRYHPNFVFRDDEKLCFGEPIAQNLLNAIECSNVSILVISENYAASEWCLRELIHIMECKENRGQIVLPVLYKVKPKDVRHLGGSFGEAFESCKDQFEEEVKQQGPVALRKALDLKVFESEIFADGCEGELVKELVRVIMDEQQQDFLPPLPRNLVGIDDRVAEEENENIEALCLDERGSRVFMKQESFKKMPNLKFLHAKDVNFDGDFEGSFAQLRWLKWERCCHSFKATNFHLEKLVVLDLSEDYLGEHHISKNWRGWSSIKMERLKVLNLSRCFKLQSTPNLSMFKNLELLILEYCTSLKEIDASIGDVKRLISLNLKYCIHVTKLPKQLGELENLEELVVDHTNIKEIPPCIGSLKKLKTLRAVGCLQSNLQPTEVPSSIVCPVSLSLVEYHKSQPIPSSIGKLGELVELNLSNTRIKELPGSIGELNKLKILRICGSQIERLPRSIGKLQNLQELDASRCPNLEGQFHVDKGGLSSLKTFRLINTKISGLPENLDQLSSLEHLDLGGCGELQSLPKPPFSLSSLKLTCWSNELPSLSHLKHLKELRLSSCKSLQSIPEISHLKHLRELSLHDCWSLQSIPELPSCIRKLDIWGCPELERLPNLSDLEFLSKLRLLHCEGLKKLDGLEALKSLRELCLKLFPMSSNLDDFDEKADELQSDNFDEEADNLHAIEGLEKLGSLEVVDISGRKHIQVLDLSKSEHLKKLDVSNCGSLVEIRCPSQLLEDFDRDGCKSLKKLLGFLPHYVQDLRGKKQLEAD